MKRRISIGILCLVMLALCLFAFASCGGSCEHEWGDWDVTLDATCTQDGEREHTCTKCGNTEREIIDAKGHAYGAWTTTTPATCTEEGLKTRTCANCSHSEEATTYALGHTYGDWMVEIKNTCTTNGIKAHYFCSRCNLNYDANNNLIEDLVIPAAHTFDTTWGYKEADGHAHLCTKCDAKSEIEAHTSGGAATPTTPEICTVCEYVITPANGHVCAPEEEWAYNSTHHWHECAGCEDQQYNYGTHVYDNACDSTCNDCGATRGITHTYDNSCDTTCNVCDGVREINHTYDNNCDEECNVCGHDRTVNHVWENDCDDQCNLCGATRTVEHDWETITIPADCENQGTTYKACSKCGKVDSSTVSYIQKTACTESYSVKREPSCQLEGIGVYTCDTCGKEREITIAKLPHDYSNTVVTPPTCEADGYTTYSCACGDSYIDDETDAIGHDYQEATDECYGADCENDGLYVEICANCQDREETVIPATGHNMVDPTCTADGYCANGCGKAGEPATSHNYEIVDEDLPDCVNDGSVTYECSVCHDSYTETPDTHKATGHNEAAIVWDKAEEQVAGTTCQYRIVATGVCPDCNETVTKTGEAFEKHNYTCAISVPDTCQTTGTKTYTCIHGDHSYNSDYEDPDAHTWGTGVTENGITTYTCACGETKTEVAAADNQAISSEALNSSEQVKLENATVALDDKVKEQVGQSDVKLSAGILSGEELENAIAGLDDDQLELLGDSKIYNFTMSIGDTATSQFDGMVTIRVPYDLDGEDPENITVWYIKDGTPTIVDAKYIIVDGQGYAEFSTKHFSYYTVTKLTPAERCERYGHNFVTQVLPATCMEGGYTLKTCRRCGYKEYSDNTEALGHSYILNEHTLVEASCTVAGQATYNCERCQANYTVKTKATGHSWSVDSVTEASCSANGATHYGCDNCDASYDTIIPKVAHEYESVVTPATCTQGGFTTNTCADCGHVTVTNRTPATRHSFVDNVVAPTCYSEGYTSHICEKCGTARANTNVIPATGHAWNIPEATCTEDKVCIHCNEREAKALGHEYVDGTCVRCDDECLHENVTYSHDSAPTCDKVGYKVYKCDVCHAFVNGEEIPATGHEFDLFDEADATCTEPGYRTEKCSTCGCSTTEITAEPTGHDYENGICNNCGAFCEHEHTTVTEEQAANCTEDGFVTVVCDDCGVEITTVTDEALGHDIQGGVCTRCGIECAHNDFVYSRDIAPTCTTPGYRVDVCSGCGQERKTETLAALGHNYVDGRCQNCFEFCKHDNVTYSHDEAPTCQTTGAKIYVCDDCSTEVVGEIIAIVDHNYVTVSETAATCQRPATKTEKCSFCDVERTVQTAPAIDHTYVDGVCSMCGETESVSGFYQTLLGCWADFKGFAIRIEDLSYVMSMPTVDANGNQVLAVQGSITMDLAELMLYVDENGKLQGAAYGTATIFNGPVPMEDATLTVQAVIANDKIYITISGNVNGNGDENLYLVASVDKLIESLKQEMFGTGFDEMLPEIEALYNEQLLPLIENIATACGKNVDTAMATVFEILFTKESVDGGFVFTLDFEKLAELNENLATLTVKELVDLYVGEGSFDAAVTFVTDLLALEASELVAFLNESGIPADDIVALINAIGSFSMEEEFDLESFLNNPELAGVKLGAMAFENENYTEQLDGIVKMLSESSLYALVAEKAEDVKAMVGQYIAMIDEMVDFSFATTTDGVITSVNLGLAIEMPMNGYNQSISASVTIVPDGRFDVTWGDIADKIEDSYVAPDREDETSPVEENYNMYQGGYIYEGQKFEAAILEYTYRYSVRSYSKMLSVMIMEDCTDWQKIDYVYERSTYTATYLVVNLMNPENGELYKTLVVNEATGEVAELTMDSKTGVYTFVLEDGTTGTITVTPDADGAMTIEYLYTTIFTGIFGEIEYERGYTSSYSTYYYYNPKTGEITERSHHNFVLDENASYEPVNCGKDGCRVYVCTECGATVKEYYNNFDHNYAVDPDLGYTPGGCNEEGYRVYVCSECGDSYRSYFWKEHEWTKSYELEAGATSCEQGVYIYEVCTLCGEKRESGYSTNHQIAPEFSYEGGSLNYSASCAACDGYKGGTGTYMRVDTEYNLIYAGNRDKQVYFAFTPEESGYYSYYSTAFTGGKEGYFDTVGAIYDAEGNHLAEDDYRLDYDQFGIEFYFEAGKTYYLVSYTLGEIANNAYAIHLEPVTYDYVDLSEYCDCGFAQLIIENKFGRTYCKVEGDCQWAYNTKEDDKYEGEGDYIEKPEYEGSFTYDYCTVCGFAYSYDESYSSDESCNEICTERYMFGNQLTGEMLGEYVVRIYNTGNTNHTETTRESYNRTEETTDENGNYVRNEIWGATETCNICGNVIYAEESIDSYDENGNRVRYQYKYSTWSGLAGALVTERSEDTGYVTLTDENGYSYEETLYSYNCYYDRMGNLSYWYRNDFEYITRCVYIRTYTDSNNAYDVETVSYHYEQMVDFEEGDSEYDYVDENGNTVHVSINAYGVICPTCGTVYNKYENAISYIDGASTFDQVIKKYVLDEATGTWYLNILSERVYGEVEAMNGQIANYILSEHKVYYDIDGVAYDDSTYRYDYCYGDYCHYDLYVKTEKGEEWRSEEGRENHLAIYNGYKLSEGSATCEDGLDYYEVCLVCGYNEVIFERDAYEHRSDPLTTEIFDLADYGCFCGSYAVMTNCPCGESSFLDVVTNAYITEEIWNWEGDEERINYYCAKYACDCGFTFTYESWFSVGDACEEIFHRVYTLGTNTDAPFVVDVSYATGEYRHNAEYSENYSEEETVDENGNYVRISIVTEAYTCQICGNVTDEHKREHHYDENGNEVYYSYTTREMNSLGELTVRHSVENRRVVMTYGEEIRVRPLYEVTGYYNELGECTYWYRYDYEYHSYCHTTSIYTNMNGERNVSERYDHREDIKQLPEESYVEGNTVVVATERYCSKCYASLEKNIFTTVSDDNGCLVSTNEKRYVVCESGWRLNEEITTTYATAVSRTGETTDCILTYENVYYDENGEVWDYRHERYDYRYGSYCEYDKYVIDEVNGEEWLSETNSNNHLWTRTTYKLSEGSVTCEDGLDAYDTCMYCDYERLWGEKWLYYHENDVLSAEKVDLSAYGAMCGTYANVSTCVCGQRCFVDVVRTDEMYFDSESSWGWEGDEVRYDYYICTYGCAVTDPTECGFTYTYESWYTVDETCLSIYHVKYVFGVGSDDPYVVEYSYETKNYRHDTRYREDVYESYEEDGYTVVADGYSYACQNCGLVTSTYKSTYYQDENGNNVKRHNDEYSYYDIPGQVLSSHIHNEYIYVEVDNVYGKRSTEFRTYHKQNRYNTDGSERYWEEYVYTYTDCIYTSSYEWSNSNGESGSDYNVHSYYNYHFDHYEVAPTCTTGGVEYRVCVWCLEGKTFDVGPNGHYTYYDWDNPVVEPTCTQRGIVTERCRNCTASWETSVDAYGHSYYSYANGSYTCERCGLTNFTGYDGNIQLEDLTARLGNGEYYVIGYDSWSGYEYMVVLSLVVEGLDEPIFLDTYVDVQESLIYISLADVKAEVESLGYSICSESLRVSFLPVDVEGQIDYAITLDPHYCEKVVDSHSCGYQTVSYVCTLCDEICRLQIVASSNCTGFYVEDNSYEGDDGVWHNVSAHHCVDDCGYSYTVEQWEVYDESLGFNIVHTILSIDLEGDGEAEYSWYTTDNFIWNW